MMVLNDLLAYRQAQTGAVGLAVGGEGLEKPAEHLRGDALARVVHFRHDRLAAVDAERQPDLAAVGHGIGGVADEIVEDARQALRIDPHQHGRRLVDELQRDRFDGDLLLNIFDQLKDKGAVVQPGQNKVGMGALDELQQFIDHVANALDLLSDADFGNLAGFRRGRRHAGHVGGEADDVEGILEIMNDGTGETADQGKAFGLQHLLGVFFVEITDALAGVTQNRQRQARGVAQEFEQVGAGDEIDDGLSLGDRAQGARIVVQRGHFTEEVALRGAGKGAGLAVRHNFGQVDDAILDHINAVAGVAFLEDGLAGGIGAFLRHPAHFSKVGGREVTEQFAGFQCHHGGSLSRRPGR